MHKVVIFIKKTDDINNKTQEILTKIYANSPKLFIISGCEPRAMQKCTEIKDNVMAKLADYDCESYNTNDKAIYFLNRNSDIES